MNIFAFSNILQWCHNAHAWNMKAHMFRPDITLPLTPALWRPLNAYRTMVIHQRHSNGISVSSISKIIGLHYAYVQLKVAYTFGVFFLEYFGKKKFFWNILEKQNAKSKTIFDHLRKFLNDIRE